MTFGFWDCLADVCKPARLCNIIALLLKECRRARDSISIMITSGNKKSTIFCRGKPTHEKAPNADVQSVGLQSGIPNVLFRKERQQGHQQSLYISLAPIRTS
ncbi:hypothetical protein PoB_007370600 [Plakobranchus ocellatus]|uniref:Uncharacterized protein n=1 Tax=Plakobranchus ocellatus TaxID=259542 RepID=A0AAV4DTI8_9GAST|nr:hypothetical protein PoB_007370600 [Plakobranchus ocellatus]